MTKYDTSDQANLPSLPPNRGQVSNTPVAGQDADYCLASPDSLPVPKQADALASGILVRPPYARRLIKDCDAGMWRPFLNRMSQSSWREWEDAAGKLGLHQAEDVGRC